ncbi:hypothetical protein PISMIDRAFT_677800 [Pisolithus microcarpus 441]|uniref:Uncharacterized protein n=1 Tax=Pisolithus microcarpus 441 TaxID=765257 RepID=A0A0C9Z691_9AGAM|nr:hypothetical protein PISMIDRAFT_677800 [Pisolithus microcarpus 441]
MRLAPSAPPCLQTEAVATETHRAVQTLQTDVNYATHKSCVLIALCRYTLCSSSLIRTA